MFYAVQHAFALVLVAAALLAQEPVAPTFNSDTRLVLVPFNVERGKSFAADLQPSDLILREDGHPRAFTTFEGPTTKHPLPLELVLLFDTTRVPANLSPLGDPKADYEFLGNWDEASTRAVLQKSGMDIRLAVYHYAGHQLERICGATSNPGEIVQAFHAVLDPIPRGKGELTLLPGDEVIKPLFQTPFMGWLAESIVSTLKDAAASPVAARRVLIVFTRGSSGTTTTSLESMYSGIVDPALALSIPIDPVMVNQYKQKWLYNAPGPGRVLDTVPGAKANVLITPEPTASQAGVAGGVAYRNLPWFTSVGRMTGGEAFVPPRLDRDALAAILELARDRTASQYVLGFVPDAAPKPKKHSLTVRLTSKSAGKVISGEKDGVEY